MEGFFGIDANRDYEEVGESHPAPMELFRGSYEAHAKSNDTLPTGKAVGSAVHYGHHNSGKKHKKYLDSKALRHNWSYVHEKSASGTTATLVTEDSKRKWARPNYPYLKIAKRGDYVGALRKHLRKLNITLGDKEALARREVGPTKPLIWLHIHKEAGSFTCLAAVVNGERVVAPSVNCNWRAHDLIWGKRCNSSACAGDGIKGVGAKYFQGISCSGRRDYFYNNNFTFGEIERELHPEDVCTDYFRYGTALRDPMASLASKVAFESRGFLREARSRGIPVPSDGTFQNSWFKALLHQVFGNGNTSVQIYGLPLWKLLDNYKIRAILGESAFNVGPGRINSTHLRKAVQRLGKFDFIKILDLKSGKPELNQDWHGTSVTINWKREVPRRENKLEYNLAFDNETTAYLTWLNKYDIALFNTFAQYLDPSLAANLDPALLLEQGTPSRVAGSQSQRAFDQRFPVVEEDLGSWGSDLDGMGAESVPQVELTTGDDIIIRSLADSDPESDAVH